MKRVCPTFAIVLFLFSLGCKKSENATILKVKLTDAPATYDEVNIDLQEVRVNFESDTAHWTTLPTRSGIYNLLDLQNGVDTLIAEGAVPAGIIKEIRLVLGENNSIKSNDSLSPLTIPSGGESGLKIKLQHSSSGSLDSLLIDFDAALSIKTEGDKYMLRPVLKIID